MLPPSLGHRPKGGILATGGSKRCITVSTLAEAEFYADAGFEVRLEKGVKGGMGEGYKKTKNKHVYAIHVCIFYQHC